MAKCEAPAFQLIRVVDVFVLGPVMIGAGRKVGGKAGAFLAIAGAATIIFNAVNFLDIAQITRE